MWLSVGVGAEECGALTHVRLAHGIVDAAGWVPAAGAIPAAYCRIEATSRPSRDSDIHFEVWIPAGDAWNGKFEQVGNGGFAGAIPAASMAAAVARGYAVAGTDDGHRSADMTDAAWALGHDEKVRDYGWRAIRETTLAAKQLLRQFKGRTQTKSYFVGCSDGGREALMMAQRFPTSFDGIVAGAPAWTMTRLLTGGAVRGARINASEGHLPPEALALLQGFVLRSCAGGAGYLEDPRNCKPDLDALKCGARDSNDCLTDPQLAAARAIYQDQIDPAGGGLLYGVLPGAEAAKGSWDAWLTGTRVGEPSIGLRFTGNYLANMVMQDPHVDAASATASVADLARGERHFAPLMDAADPDLRAFKSHGGRLLQYHGWNDPAIPAGYSLEYRARVERAMGPLDGFYRLYMVPGMLHCGGGPAPTSVDWQTVIEAWVERGIAPGVLTARDASGGSQTLHPYGAAL
jgi:feruloyl esterase